MEHVTLYNLGGNPKSARDLDALDWMAAYQDYQDYTDRLNVTTLTLQYVYYLCRVFGDPVMPLATPFCSKPT